MKKGYPTLTLRQGKEISIKYRHPWVFSGALESPLDGLKNGELVRVADSEGKILGTGTFSNRSMIAVRVFEFADAVIDRKWLTEKIQQAVAYRELLGYGDETTGYRVCFSEADGLPGLIVDKYDDVLVLQISTLGMEALKPMVVDILKSLFSPSAIVEQSDLPVRKEEGLPQSSGILWGKFKDAVEFMENGHQFVVSELRSTDSRYPRSSWPC